MRNWKKILSITLGMSLVFHAAAYAELTIPPLPFETGADSQLGSTYPQGTGGAALPGQNQDAGGISDVGPGGGAGDGAGVQTPQGGNPAGNGGLAPGSGTGNAGGTGAGNTAGTGAGSTAGTGAGSTAGTGTTAGGAAAGNTDTAALQEPVVVAEGAVLMDAATGQVLYGKNQDKQFYPASITKIMTALVVLERCSLTDVVTFSASATTNLESGAVSLNITEGDQLTVEQALYGLLLKSANEIGNGLAEHVGGSISGFADLMNAKAKELGCKNTHFANPHGLNDSTHMTTPYDMALIMRAALQNETFRKIDTTLTYNFPATKKAGARTITMGHKMMYPSDSRYYEGIIGGKTGYTSKAGNTLVTGAEQNGVRLVAVVMKSKGTQYTDTKALLDYGFANYAALTENGGGTGASGSGGNSGGSGASGPAGNSGQTPASGTGLTGQASAGWVQDSQGWYYIKADGTRASGEWQTINGREYWFDDNAYMAVGFRQFSNGDWYYFKENSGMAKNCWIEDQGDWFYLGADGVLLRNTRTPDGYPVDENGIWRQ